MNTIHKPMQRVNAIYGSWFELERQLSGQRQQPGWIQLRHDKYRRERWTENRNNVKKNPKN